MELRYDYAKLKQALQDEYMAASLVGFGADTPDIMDIEFSDRKELLVMAERCGLELKEFLITEDENG